MIVLGDARTNGREPHAEIFARISERAGRTFWLNPEPKLYWNYGDSVMAAYEPYCNGGVRVLDHQAPGELRRRDRRRPRGRGEKRSSRPFGRPVRRSTYCFRDGLAGLVHLAATVALGSQPTPATQREVAAWSPSTTTATRPWMWLLTISVPLLAAYAAVISVRLPALHRDRLLLVRSRLPTKTRSRLDRMAWHADSSSPPRAGLLDVASSAGRADGTTVMYGAGVLLALRRDAGFEWLGVPRANADRAADRESRSSAPRLQQRRRSPRTSTSPGHRRRSIAQPRLRRHTTARDRKTGGSRESGLR